MFAMESVIREGTLRLQTAETTCDVILSCQGHRLMAHKLILSIASPILQNLLKENSSAPSVVILPDINSNIMTLILDYIYTGSVIVYSKTLPEFLAVAELLKIHLDIDALEKHIDSPSSESSKNSFNEEYKTYKPEQVIKKKEEIFKDLEKTENLDVMSPNSPEVYSRKNLRKLPNLLPLNTIPNRRDKTRRLCNYVSPSPWCPRIETVLADPRTDYLGTSENQISPLFRDKIEENDSNNNFQFNSIPRYLPNHITDPLMRIYPTGKPASPKEFDLSHNRSNFSVESRLLPHRNNIFKPSTISSSSNLSITSFTNTKSERTKIDSIASKLEKQKSLEIATNEKNAKNSVLELTISPIEKTNEERKQFLTRKSSCNETGVRESLSFSSSNDEDEKSLESCEDGKLKAKQKAFKCEDCGKSFSQLRNYKYHRSVHEGTKEFAAKCPECGKVFNDRGYLSSHMKIHRDRKEYACPHCPKRFNQRVAYNMHLRIHTGVKPHECPTCGKSFSRKMLLKQHQRVHTGERPYSCPECGKTFADRSNMSLHARLHTGVKPYACNLCPKSFTKKHHLKTHMNFHTGLKPYTCQKCGLAFSQSSNMRTHYKKCILKNTTANPAMQQGTPPERPSGQQS